MANLVAAGLASKLPTKPASTPPRIVHAAACKSPRNSDVRGPPAKNPADAQPSPMPARVMPVTTGSPPPARPQHLLTSNPCLSTLLTSLNLQASASGCKGLGCHGLKAWPTLAAPCCTGRICPSSWGSKAQTTHNNNLSTTSQPAISGKQRLTRSSPAAAGKDEPNSQLLRRQRALCP